MLSIIVLDIFKTWYNYPMIGPIEQWLKTPELQKSIDTNGRLLSFGMEEKWNEEFLKNGWSKNSQYYNFLRNF